MVSHLAPYRSDASPLPRSELRMVSELQRLTGENSRSCHHTTASPSSTRRRDPSASVFVEPSPWCHHLGPCDLATLTSGFRVAGRSSRALASQRLTPLVPRCDAKPVHTLLGVDDVVGTAPWTSVSPPTLPKSPSPLGGVVHPDTPEGAPRQHRRPPVKEADVASGQVRGELESPKGSEPVPLSG